MSTIHDWNKYQDLLHEFALVEDKLRQVQSENQDEPMIRNLATYLLYAHFESYP